MLGHHPAMGRGLPPDILPARENFPADKITRVPGKFSQPAHPPFDDLQMALHRDSRLGRVGYSTGYRQGSPIQPGKKVKSLIQMPPPDLARGKLAPLQPAEQSRAVPGCPGQRLRHISRSPRLATR